MKLIIVSDKKAHTITVDSGYVILFKGYSLLAKLIQFFTRSKWNHAGCFIVKEGFKNYLDAKRNKRATTYDNTMSIEIYESLQHGIINSNALQRLKGEKIKIKKATADYDIHNLKVLANSYLTRVGYDKMTLLVYQPLYILTGWWIGKNSDKKQTCSEFISRIYQDSIKFKKDSLENYDDKVTPKDIDTSPFFEDVFEGYIDEIEILPN